MVNIRLVKKEDKDFWFTLDKHLAESEFERKVRDKMGYIIEENGKQVGILRYNLFWDNTPFCAMLFVDWSFQKKGYGKMLMQHWENEMKNLGYKMIMTSTQVDETSQHFYRKLGFKDAGGLLINIPGFEQAMEMFLIKGI